MSDEKEEMILISKEFLNSVAHIGVDFGYGPYQLDRDQIQYARDMLNKHDDENTNEK